MAPATPSRTVQALLVGWLASTLVFALSEALHVPLAVYAHRPVLLPGAIAHATALQLSYVAVAVLLQASALVRAALWPGLGFGRSFLWHALPAALTSAEMIWVLSDNPTFMRQRAPLALIVTITPVLALAYAALGAADLPRGRLGALLTSKLLGPACVLGTLIVQFVNYTAYPNRYPSYHLALTQLALVLLQLGATHLAFALRAGSGSTRRLGALCVAATLGLAVPALLGALPEARGFLALHSRLGSAPSVRSYQPWREDVLAQPLPDVPAPAAEFRERTRLPPIPEDFSLADYNVLLVLSETTRYDQTSLTGKLDTTPSLAALASSAGGHSFSEAYAPSSGTLYVVTSLMSMTYPSAARVRSWQRRWNGVLDERTDTVAELFAREGRHTFWIGHNLKCFFDQRVLGVAQGFSHVERAPCSPSVADPDVWIAQTAVKHLRTLARTPERRFFGWVFFDAPHEPYRPPGMDPEGDQLDLYRGEIRHTDTQLGLVLQALRDSGLWENTVVIFMGDHGEELGEHGGEAHCTEVFGESAHVPLVVRVPGTERAAHAGLVSTTHVLPWLMLHGGAGMRASVERRLRREIVPMLRATDDAVVIELLGQDRMIAALRTPERSVHYDFIAGQPEVYDLTRDPGELHRLYGQTSADLSADLARIEGYRRVRASTRRFGLDPEHFVEVPAE